MPFWSFSQLVARTWKRRSVKSSVTPLTQAKLLDGELSNLSLSLTFLHTSHGTLKHYMLPSSSFLYISCLEAPCIGQGKSSLKYHFHYSLEWILSFALWKMNASIMCCVHTQKEWFFICSLFAAMLPHTLWWLPITLGSTIPHHDRV